MRNLKRKRKERKKEKIKKPKIAVEFKEKLKSFRSFRKSKFVIPGLLTFLKIRKRVTEVSG